jgi:hypothetical protein
MANSNAGDVAVFVRARVAFPVWLEYENDGTGVVLDVPVICMIEFANTSRYVFMVYVPGGIVITPDVVVPDFSIVYPTELLGALIVLKL